MKLIERKLNNTSVAHETIQDNQRQSSTLTFESSLESNILSFFH